MAGRENMQADYDHYHQTRLDFDPRRRLLWKTLNDAYFSRFYGANDCLLDVGCGYGDFINTAYAGRRIGLDSWPGFTQYLEPGVEEMTGDLGIVKNLEDRSIDFVMASNIFEHITQPSLQAFLHTLRDKLSPQGTLNILQPNYRYAYREYFDDYTHVAVYSHISLCDFLHANDYNVTIVKPRFLPLTIKSRLPVSPALIRLYLSLPFKPLGKQMFIQAKPAR